MERGASPAVATVAGANVVGRADSGNGKPVPAPPAVPLTSASAQAAQVLRKAGVSVRLAQTEADLAAMIVLGRLLHAESRYRALPLDDARMLQIGRRGLANGNPGLLMAERDGKLIGMAIVMLGEHFFSPALAATVQLLYVAPQARGGAAAVKLLRALRRWAAQNGAHDLHVNVTTGIEAARTDRFLRHMGFRQTGGNYVLEDVFRGSRVCPDQR